MYFVAILLFLVVGKENIAAVIFLAALITDIVFSKDNPVLSSGLWQRHLHHHRGKKGISKNRLLGLVGGLSGACGDDLLWKWYDAQMIIRALAAA